MAVLEVTRRPLQPLRQAPQRPSHSLPAPVRALPTILRQSHPSKAASRPIAAAPSRAAVSKGSGTLPNDKGQVWREYDIRPYTLRVDHRTARAGDRRLDPPRNRLRSLALRTGRPAQRQSRRAPRLSHARDAGHRRRYRRPLRQLGGQCLRLHAPRGHGPQSELAGQGAADDDADPRAIAGRARLAAGQGKRTAAALRAQPPHRLPRIQLVAAAREQRPVDRALHDAAAVSTSAARWSRKPPGPAISPKWARSKKASRSSSARCCRSTWRRPTRS